MCQRLAFMRAFLFELRSSSFFCSIAAFFSKTQSERKKRLKVIDFGDRGIAEYNLKILKVCYFVEVE